MITEQMIRERDIARQRDRHAGRPLWVRAVRLMLAPIYVIYGLIRYPDLRRLLKTKPKP